jgi:hypothetical protein
MRRHLSRAWELVQAYVFSGLACVVIVTLNHRYLFCSPQAVNDLLPNALNILGIVISFLAASQAVLLSLGDRQFVQRLKQTGTYQRLHNLFSHTIMVLFATVVLSVVLTILPHTRAASLGHWFYYLTLLWIFLGIAGALNALRLIFFFSDIVRHSASE